MIKRAKKKTEKRGKRTETINYRREIWEYVALNQQYGLTKDDVCNSIRGNRKVVFSDINILIKEKILEYINGKLGISKNDLEIKRGNLVSQLENFKETRKNTINQIKEKIKNSPVGKKSFFYQKDFKYTVPVSHMQDASRWNSEGVVEEEKEEGDGKIDWSEPLKPSKKGDAGATITTKIYYINDDAKQWIFMIPQLLDGIVRGSFSLYASQMLMPVSTKIYKEIFEVDIKRAINEITKTRKMLLDLMLEFSKNKKGDTKFFDSWWTSLTFGLTLEFEPFSAEKLGALAKSKLSRTRWM